MSKVRQHWILATCEEKVDKKTSKRIYRRLAAHRQKLKKQKLHKCQ